MVAEKETYEVRVGLGDECNAVALGKSKAQELVRKFECLCAQFAVGNAGVDSAAAGVEVGTGFAFCSVVERFSQRGEISRSKWQTVIRWCGCNLIL